MFTPRTTVQRRGHRYLRRASGDHTSLDYRDQTSLDYRDRSHTGMPSLLAASETLNSSSVFRRSSTVMTIFDLQTLLPYSSVPRAKSVSDFLKKSFGRYSDVRPP